MKARLGFLAAAIAAWTLAVSPKAWAEAGLTGANTLRVPIGARAIGLGESFCSVDGDVESMGYNPAGTAAAARPAIATTYVHGLIDDSFSFLGYVHPTTLGVLSLGGIYYDAGAIHLNLSDGTDRSVKAAQDMVGMAGWSVKLGNGLAAGALAKFYKFILAEQAQASGYAADGGLLWHSPVAGLNFGASVQNFGPDVKFEQEGDPLPLTQRFGASYLLNFRGGSLLKDVSDSFTQFLFTADAIKVRDERLAAATGLEMSMPLGASSRGALRFGYLFNRDIDSLSVGVGFKEGRFLMDYAIGVKRAINHVHNFSLGYLF